MAQNVKLKLACGPYDRIDALRRGEVTAAGVDIDFEIFKFPRDIFDRCAKGLFDVSEFSSSEFISMWATGKCPFVAIPVFPSKVFRHGFVTINRRSGIRTPNDLAGRRIGVPLYTMTAAIWMRGMLEDDFGVDLSGVTWVQGAVEKAGSHGDNEPPPLLRPVRIEDNRSDGSLDDLLVAGMIDALIGARLPPSLGKDPDIVRLFPDFRAAERDYFRRTRIHPIMHLMVIKKEVHERHPHVARALYKAFDKAKELAWSELRFSGAQKCMLPFINAEVAETVETFGEDPWPYGIEGNRPTLEALVSYMHKQHFIAHAPRIEELFVDVGA